MKILKEGDSGEAICHECEQVVRTRYEYRSVHLEETDVTVQDVLVGVCEDCESTVTIPAQSTPKLKKARQTKQETVQFRLPRHLDDVLNVIAEHYGVPPSRFTSALLRYYMRELEETPSFRRRLQRLTESPLAVGTPKRKMSLRLSHELLKSAEETIEAAGLQNRSAMLRALVVAAKEDVLEGRAKRRSRDLEGIAGAV